MQMMMWALIDKNGFTLPVRFQQDDLPFGGTHIANTMLAKLTAENPEQGWHLELQIK